MEREKENNSTLEFVSVYTGIWIHSDYSLAPCVVPVIPIYNWDSIPDMYTRRRQNSN